MTERAAAARKEDSEPRRRYPWWLGLAARVGIWVLNLLWASWRVRVGAGVEHWRALQASDQPLVFAFWHNRLIVCAELIWRHHLPKGRPLALLTSLSRDGELAARMAGMRGYRIIRGSTSRGGLGSMLRLQRAMRRERYSAALAPDGPRGPAYEVQPGMVLLAKISGAPIVPVAYAASRCWRVRSWDRLVVPKPFARAVMTVGEPIEVPKDLPNEELVAVSADLKRRLDELVSVAETMV